MNNWNKKIKKKYKFKQILIIKIKKIFKSSKKIKIYNWKLHKIKFLWKNIKTKLKRIKKQFKI